MPLIEHWWGWWDPPFSWLLCPIISCFILYFKNKLCIIFVAQRTVATNLTVSSSKRKKHPQFEVHQLGSSNPLPCIDQTLNGVHVPLQFSFLSKNFTFVFQDIATKIDPSIIVPAKRIVARPFKSQNNIRSLRCIQKDHVSNSNALIKHWKGWHVPFSSVFPNQFHFFFWFLV